MDLSKLFNFNPLQGDPKPEEGYMVVIPVTDLIRLQKGYIYHLEEKIDKTESKKTLDDMSHKIQKIGRDSAMILADTIKLALDNKDYKALEELERKIRKQAFGTTPESEGI